jgi:uncharacterized membrane protein YraQ (UPF0718 family)
MAVQAASLNLSCAPTTSATWRTRSLILILMTVIATYFWVESRYPALMKRYHAGTQIKVSGALTFGGVYKVDPSMSYLQRVWYTTVNWLDANRAGMTFSFLFGPAALAFFSTLRTRRTKSRFLNTLLGTVAGVPMGVCSNCIAPIARGLYTSGMSTESVLAAMFASPALNIVVLMMTFALFPMSIALLKVASVLFLIFVFVPFITARQAASEPVVNFAVDIVVTETWGEAIKTTVTSYLKSFWNVFRVAFPLMLLAAVLGALVVELIPQQALIGQATILGIIAVSLVSTFLPIPMAFDVAIAYILMTKGVPLPYVAVILCTSGVLSVFSMSVIGKTISWRIATATYGVVVCLGIVAGWVVRTMG